MARAIWSGSISFGLVNIPVKLYSAVSRKSVRFNMLDSETGTRIKQKRVNPDTGEEVPFERQVKGYELGEGRYVTVTDEELGSLDPVASRTIDLQEFVLQDEIDPVFYDSPYFLAPDQNSKKAYALLVHAMEEADRVGVARFVMRTKQYLGAMRVRDGKLMLSTMVYNDELNAARTSKASTGSTTSSSPTQSSPWPSSSSRAWPARSNRRSSRTRTASRSSSSSTRRRPASRSSSPLMAHPKTRSST